MLKKIRMMVLKVCWFLSPLIFLLLPAPIFPAPASFIAEVVAVLEGDMMKVMKTRQIFTVRLQGVDAPEKNQPYGEQAKNFTESTAFGKKVVVNLKREDQQSHLVAEVILEDGRSLNRELVKAGFAWWERDQSNDLSLWQLENKAREEKRGLWLGKDPIPPWEFRAQMRSRP